MSDRLCRPGEAPASRAARGRAVVLLSGGLDSATTLAVARADGWECFALTVRYGQRHAIEIDRARALAAHLGAREHRVVELDLRAFGGSSLLGQGEIPKSGPGSIAGAAPDGPAAATGSVAAGAVAAGSLPAGPVSPADSAIPSTYVPARNTVFLSLALAWAEVLAARAIFRGVNAVDYRGYPDCRGEFLRAFERAANLGTRRGIEGPGFELVAPLLDLSKSEIIRLGADLGVEFALTTSCYDPAPDGAPCGACDSCRIRARGFDEAGLSDPLIGGGS